MSLVLKRLLPEIGVSQGELAEATGISRPAVVAILNQGRWPSDGGKSRRSIQQFLRDRRLPAQALCKEKALRGSTPARPVSCNTTRTNKQREAHMIRKHQLNAKAMAHFRLSRDPFADCTEPADVYLNGDIRYVRETMLSKVKHGGFLAVIGESGAGKSTLREELLERLKRDHQNVLPIEPYVVGMEDNDSRGKTLKAQHIAESIMAVVAPLTAGKSSPEARFRQVHETLRDSSRTGVRHVLMIEEAHALPIPTLKHLKRFLELKDGMRPLLTIILFGQPELGLRLSDQNPEVREVVQRIEIAHLPPLDNDLQPYLKHRFGRQQVAVESVIDNGGIGALRERLSFGKNAGSFVYPLAVHNALAAAMNAAAALGAPLVTADVVKESVR